MVRRETSDRLDRIESALTGLRADLDALRSGLEARFAPSSEIERLNLVFDLLPGKAPASEVERLNEAFDGLSRRAPLSEVARLDEAYTVLGDLRAAISGLRDDWEHRFGWHPPFPQEAFADAFRGSVDQIREQYQGLADELVGHAPVLDIGCGRGEFLALLGEREVAASGVEIDAALAAAARENGLDVVAGDAVAHLRSIVDHSLGSVVLLQVIEHLPPQSALDVLSLAADKIRIGGRLVVETVNPTSLFVYTNAFYIDPTHSNPVHPGYLMFAIRELGFASAEIRWRSPVPPEQRLRRLEGDGSAITVAMNANLDRLNEIIFGPQDYAIVAVR